MVMSVPKDQTDERVRARVQVRAVRDAVHRLIDGANEIVEMIEEYERIERSAEELIDGWVHCRAGYFDSYLEAYERPGVLAVAASINRRFGQISTWTVCRPHHSSSGTYYYRSAHWVDAINPKDAMRAADQWLEKVEGEGA